MAQNDSLSELASQAERAIRHQNSTRVSMRQNRVPSLRHILVGSAVAGFLYLSHGLWISQLPPSEKQLESQLSTIIDQAAESVSNEMSATGEMPSALPNAALAAVVRYEVRGKEYRLTTSVLGVRVMLDWNGQKVTETGV